MCFTVKCTKKLTNSFTGFIVNIYNKKYGSSTPKIEGKLILIVRMSKKKIDYR